MSFRIQDLMMDVLPGGGYQMANPECTCQITAKQPGIQRAPGEETDKPGRGPGIPMDNPACQGTILPSAACPPDEPGTRAADLGALKAQLRRDLATASSPGSTDAARAIPGPVGDPSRRTVPHLSAYQR